VVFEIGPDVLVEDEIDSGRTRDHFEHRSQVGVAELERDRPREQRPQPGAAVECVARLLLVDAAHQLACFAVAGLFGQHSAQQGGCLARLAALDQGPGVDDQCGMAPVRLQAGEAGEDLAVFGVEPLCPQVEGLGLVEAGVDARGVGACQELVDGAFALTDVIGAELGIAGRGPCGAVELFQALFDPAFGEQLLALEEGRVGGAAGKQQLAEQDQGKCAFQLALPISRVCFSFKGR